MNFNSKPSSIQPFIFLFENGYVISKRANLRRLSQGRKKSVPIIDYISAHYQEELTIDQLAKICGYSDTHFMNFFKKHLGVSCIEYVIQFRLRKAAELLQHSTLPVLEIATQSGFNNL